MPNDYLHLEKFNSDLSGDYKVHYYKMSKSYFNTTNSEEARLFITNSHFGKTLREQYGIIPFREDCQKIIDVLPNDLIKHFIRGVMDADGTFCHYNVQEDGYILNKYTIHLCGSEMLLRFVEAYFIKTGFINGTERKLYRRHKEEGRDVRCRSLILSGRNNVVSILNHLYKDADIYLNRKYDKYLEIVGDIKCNIN